MNVPHVRVIIATIIIVIITIIRPRELASYRFTRRINPDLELVFQSCRYSGA